MGEPRGEDCQLHTQQDEPPSQVALLGSVIVALLRDHSRDSKFHVNPLFKNRRDVINQDTVILVGKKKSQIQQGNTEEARKKPTQM